MMINKGNMNNNVIYCTLSGYIGKICKINE